jgi:hypothetical protein
MNLKSLSLKCWIGRGGSGDCWSGTGGMCLSGYDPSNCAT